VARRGENHSVPRVIYVKGEYFKLNLMLTSSAQNEIRHYCAVGTHLYITNLNICSKFLAFKLNSLSVFPSYLIPQCMTSEVNNTPHPLSCGPHGGDCLYYLFKKH
jgi:hypothetical protein